MNKILIMQKGMRTWQLVSILTIASLLMSAFPAGFVAAEAAYQDEPTSQCSSDVNLLTNGSFEEPEVTDTKLWQAFSPISGWTVSKVSDNTPTSLELQKGWNGNVAADGLQYAELDGNESSKINQSVTTIPGATYKLSWAFAPRYDVTHEVTAEQNQLSVLVDNGQVATNGPIAGSAAALTAGDWVNSDATFVATGENTDIAFVDAGPSDSYGTFLDNAKLCLVSEPTPQPQTCSLTLLSDGGTLVAETNEFAVSTYDGNDRWDAVVPGATWVWADVEVQNPTGTETNTFIDTFTVATPTVATLTVAADNSLDLYVNGVPVLPAVPANTYLGEKVYNILPYLVSGSNELKFVVTNEAQAGGTYQSNPAGVLYRLDLTGEADCARTTKPKDEPKTTTVTMCKLDQNEKSLSGWQLALLGDKVETLNVDSKTNKDNGSAVSSSLLPSGSYVAKAGGTFKYRGNTGLLADARFSERLPEDPTYGGAYVPWSAGITGWLYMNGDNTVWGNVFSSSTHTYYAPLAGGSTAKFYVGDSDHKDNAGSLTVDIYKGFTGVTTENGCVSFEDVPYGDYTVEELLQSGWTNLSGLGHVTVSSESNRFTVMNSDGTRDEDPDPKTRLLSGYKFYDINGDGDRDEGEPGIPGWTITAYNGYGTTTAVTDEDGHYQIEVSSDDEWNEWIVREVMQEGWEQTGVMMNGEELEFGQQCKFNVKFGDENGPSRYDCTFGNKEIDERTITLSGYKFNDADGDGYWDDGEVGIPGWTIKATNGEESTTAVTGEYGYYEMEVPEGAWAVSEVMQEGWVQTGVMMNGDKLTEASVCNFGYYPAFSKIKVASDNYDGPRYECTFFNKAVPVIDGGNPGDGGNGNQTTTSGGKSKTKKKPTPQVLGAATSTAPVLCPFLKDYMQRETKNDSFEVTKLQMFLSIVMGLPTSVTGIFDTTTEANVKLFQEKYRSEILDPWFKRGIVPHDRPTGFVYKTTRWKINDIICPGFEAYPSFDGENLQSNIVIR